MKSMELKPVSKDSINKYTVKPVKLNESNLAKELQMKLKNLKTLTSEEIEAERLQQLEDRMKAHGFDLTDAKNRPDQLSVEDQVLLTQKLLKGEVTD